MISPELIRRYPFFAGLEHEDIVTLAQAADQLSVETGFCFFHEEEELAKMYLIVAGSAVTVIEVPDQEVEQSVAGQLTGKLRTKDVVASTIGPGEVFGWSALVPPYTATATAKATSPCRLVVFDAVRIRQACEENCRFGYRMMQKAAQVSSSRLRDMRIESLAYLVG